MYTYTRTYILCTYKPVYTQCGYSRIVCVCVAFKFIFMYNVYVHLHTWTVYMYLRCSVYILLLVFMFNTFYSYSGSEDQKCPQSLSICTAGRSAVHLVHVYVHVLYIVS